jgi:hypothetical protein
MEGKQWKYVVTLEEVSEMKRGLQLGRLFIPMFV